MRSRFIRELEGDEEEEQQESRSGSRVKLHPDLEHNRQFAQRVISFHKIEVYPFLLRLHESHIMFSFQGGWNSIACTGTAVELNKKRVDFLGEMKRAYCQYVDMIKAVPEEDREKVYRQYRYPLRVLAEEIRTDTVKKVMSTKMYHRLKD